MKIGKTFLSILCVGIFFSVPEMGNADNIGLPPGEAQASSMISKSPRHGEWVSIKTESGDTIQAWLVYPERSDKAPVVIVIHEIFGLTDWIRAVTDQLAAQGFIAIAPDFLSGKGPEGSGSSGLDVETARKLVSVLEWKEIARRLNAVVGYATSLPAATDKYGVVGFCWGGGMSFMYATEEPALKAAVVFYGVSPANDLLGKIKTPVLGLYGGDDARVNSTIPAAEKELKRLSKRFEYEIYQGAGHAFLRVQDGKEGANLKAAREAWPRTINFFRQLLEKK